MTRKPVIPRQRAVGDVDEIVDFYLSEGAESAALGFLDALEEGYGHIGANPATGSTRYAHQLGLPGLRCWSLAHYPHLVFFVERDEHIDIWRVLHGKRDIGAWMRDPSN